MTAVSAKSHELQYAPRRSRRRRLAQYLPLILAIACLGFLAVWSFPRVRDHVTLLDLQRRCMAYSMPPSTVVHHNATAGMVGMSQVAPDWTRLYASISPPGLRSNGTVFLHTLRSKAGASRLVAVDVVGSWGTADLYWRVVEPGTVIWRPRLLCAGDGKLRYEGEIRIFAASADPSDPSHFTFRCEMGGRRHTIDGWLKDDDSISLVAQPHDH